MRALTVVGAQIAGAACVAALTIVAIGCSATGSSSSSSPQATAAARSSAPAMGSPSDSHPSAVLVSVGEQVDLVVGGSGSVDGRDVTFSLLTAAGPQAGCSDCPNQVQLLVACPSDRQELEYAFSGGMEEGALDRARRHTACGLEFYLVEVHDGRATVRVGPGT
jgi:hypothetical protein